MIERAPGISHLALNAYWFGVSFMWNSIHPIVLPVLLLTHVNEGAKNTAYGLLTFCGLLIALAVTPVSGALSDYTGHALGRRRPWIILGASLCLLCLLWLAFSPGLWAVIIGYLALQFSSNLAHGPAQGLIPDLVPAGRRGAASGLKTLIDMGGIIVAALVMGRLVGREGSRTWLIMACIAGVLLVSTVATVTGVRETRVTSPSRPTARRILARIHRAWHVDWGRHNEYGRLLGARFLVLLGSFLVQSFALYYLRDVVQPDSVAGAASSARAMGNLMAVIAVSITVVAYPAGVLSERWGRRTLSLVACALAAVGMSLLCLTRSLTGLLLLGCVIGLGMGAFASVNWAWATDLVPKAEAAKYLGLSNLATAGSAATARLVGPLIDLINARVPDAGYTSIFVLATLGVLGGLVVTLRMTETRGRGAANVSLPGGQAAEGSIAGHGAAGTG